VARNSIQLAPSACWAPAICCLCRRAAPTYAACTVPSFSEAEIRKLCDFLRAQGSPDYQNQKKILESSATDGDDSSHSGEQRDELYDQALRIVLDSGQASISMIQRRLRIGYNRSARMVERWNGKGS
jgi:DNA segregation ATPase FtsK/SpoIIIE-like protein